MAPLFTTALSLSPAVATRRVHSLSSSRTPRLGFLRFRRVPGAGGRGVDGGIPDEWGERSPPAPEPPSQPDPPVDDDEWGRGVDWENSSPVVIDEPGEPETEPYAAAAADPPSPATDDEWGQEQPASSSEGSEPQEDEAV